MGTVPILAVFFEDQVGKSSLVGSNKDGGLDGCLLAGALDPPQDQLDACILRWEPHTPRDLQRRRKDLLHAARQILPQVPVFDHP